MEDGVGWKSVDQGGELLGCNIVRVRVGAVEGCKMERRGGEELLLAFGHYTSHCTALLQ